MLKLRNILMWLTLTLIVILTILSIYGAFIGAEKAQVFFNCLPLTCYWVLFVLTLTAGFLAFEKLRKAPASLLVHTGCIAILIGGLLSSAQGQAIQRAWFGKPAIT